MNKPKYFSITYDMSKLSDDEQKAVIAEASSLFRSQKAVCAGWENDGVTNNGWKSVRKHGLPEENGKYLVYSCVKENVWLSNFDGYCGFNFHHEKVTHYIKIRFPNFGE
ncbi:hypothetical protein [Moraxella lacunata]|nr:hypothetical protein [Moraxella lacunata]